MKRRTTSRHQRWQHAVQRVLLCLSSLVLLTCSDLQGFECRTPADCDAPKICALGRCQPPGQIVCLSDGTCPTGHECRNGICLALGNAPACLADEDCLRDYRCIDNICQRECKNLSKQEQLRLGQPCELTALPCKGITICNKAQRLECVVDPEALSAEICDDKDNDCDGQIDEGFPDKGKPCSQGTGACRADGVYVCKADGAGLECSAAPKPTTPEICDLRDNDCDGQIDEEITGCVSTFAGPGAGGTASKVLALTNPDGLAFDHAGNFYIADHFTIRKIAPSGQLTHFLNPYRETGKRPPRPFGAWRGLAIDPSGHIYLTDEHTIRKIDKTSHKVITFAGSGEAGFRDGAPGSAQFNRPTALAFGPDGALYVADTGNHRIRKIAKDGKVTTFAGNGTRGRQEGKAQSAQFSSPKGLAFDKEGNLYVADTGNYRIRKIDKDGNVTTFAGSGTRGTKDGSARGAQFTSPGALAFGADGRLYVIALFDDTSLRIRQVDKDGAVTTFASRTTSKHPLGESPPPLAIDPQGALYTVEANKILKVAKGGEFETFITDDAAGDADGKRAEARFNRPKGLAFDSAGNLYVADTGNHKIRKIDTTGNVTTVAGDGKCRQPDPKDIQRYVDCHKDGPGRSAQLFFPSGLAFDKTGNLYIADSGNNQLRKLDTTGNVTTLPDVYLPFPTSRWAPHKSLFAFSGLAFGPDGALYAADNPNGDLRKIDKAGKSVSFGSLTDCKCLKRNTEFPFECLEYEKCKAFDAPQGLAIDAAGNLYVADLTLHKVDPTGKVTRITIQGTAPTGQGGIGLVGLVFGADGQLFVSSGYGNSIVRIDAAGRSTTLAGDNTGAITGGYLDGPAKSARFGSPSGMAIGPDGALYIADTGNHRIRRIQLPQGRALCLATCKSDADCAGCKEGKTNCTQGVCRVACPDSCLTDAECRSCGGGRNACQEGLCAATAATGKPCSQGQPCEQTQTCLRVSEKESYCFQSCASDADCPSGRRCTSFGNKQELQICLEHVEKGGECGGVGPKQRICKPGQTPPLTCSQSTGKCAQVVYVGEGETCSKEGDTSEPRKDCDPKASARSALRRTKGHLHAILQTNARSGADMQRNNTLRGGFVVCVEREGRGRFLLQRLRKGQDLLQRRQDPGHMHIHHGHPEHLCLPLRAARAKVSRSSSVSPHALWRRVLCALKAPRKSRAATGLAIES